MPIYMFQGRYTSAAIAAMTNKPEDRTDAVKSVTERLGGKLLGFWMSFGEYDYVGICELPDSMAAATFALATSAGGALQDTKTTELIDWADAMKCMKNVGNAKYHPPGKKA
jgi:uncharacterized protein with GYD domain